VVSYPVFDLPGGFINYANNLNTTLAIGFTGIDNSLSILGGDLITAMNANTASINANLAVIIANLQATYSLLLGTIASGGSLDTTATNIAHNTSLISTNTLNTANALNVTNSSLSVIQGYTGTANSYLSQIQNSTGIANIYLDDIWISSQGIANNTAQTVTNIAATNTALNNTTNGLPGIRSSTQNSYLTLLTLAGYIDHYTFSAGNQLRVTLT